MRYLHVVIDQKFIDGAISLFESDNRVFNEYVLVSENFFKFNYIKSDKIKLINSEAFLKLCLEFDAVVLHSLPALKLSLFFKIPPKIKIIWLAWGYDLYEHKYNSIIPIEVFLPITKRYLEKIHIPFRSRLKKYLDSILFRFILNRILSRIDYFSGVFPYEYDEIKRYHDSFKAKPLDFYYGAAKFFIPEFHSREINLGKKDIIIGNSANPANNHLDALNYLTNIQNKISEVRLIIPLSYGGSDDYIDEIKRFSTQNLSCDVLPLEDYLPLEQYLNIVSNCKAAIFAHERQQASDNIFLQILYGAKVYMSETSLAYQYLIKQGFIIHSLQKEIDKILDDVPEEEIIHNRKLLSEQYSSSKLLNRIIVMNDKVMSNR